MSLYTLRMRSCDFDQQIYASSSGQRFFSSVPNGVFNLLSNSLELKEFGKLHEVIQSNKEYSARREMNLRSGVHYAKPLFDTFTSKEALSWMFFVRNIDARGWELHLKDPLSGSNQTEYLSHSGSILEACEDGELTL